MIEISQISSWRYTENINPYTRKIAVKQCKNELKNILTDMKLETKMRTGYRKLGKLTVALAVPRHYTKKQFEKQMLFFKRNWEKVNGNKSS